MQTDADGQHEFNSNGSMRLFLRSTATAWRACFAVWFTNEDFPTNDIV